MQTPHKTVGSPIDEILIEVRMGEHTIADFDARAEEHIRQLITDVLRRLGYAGSFWLRLGRVISKASKHKEEVTVLKPCPPSSVALQIDLRAVANGLVFEAWLEVPDDISSEIFYDELAEILDPNYEKLVATHVHSTPIVRLPDEHIARLQQEFREAQFSDEVAVFLVSLIYSLITTLNPGSEETFTQKEIRLHLISLLRLHGQKAKTVPRWYFDRLLVGRWVTPAPIHRYKLTRKALEALETKVAAVNQGATLNEITEQVMQSSPNLVDQVDDNLPPDEGLEKIEHFIACAEAERQNVLKEKQRREQELDKQQRRVEEIRNRMQELEQVLTFQQEELNRVQQEYDRDSQRERLDALVGQIGRLRHQRRQMLQSDPTN